MRFKIAPDIVANSLGAFPDVSIKRLREMAERSAPYSHTVANRRNGTVLLKVVDGVVVAAFQESLLMLRQVKVVCSDCQNDGGYCESCHSRGHLTMPVGEALSGNHKLLEKDDEYQGIVGASPRVRSRPGVWRPLPRHCA